MRKPKAAAAQISDRVRLRGRGHEGWLIWLDETTKWAWVWWDAWERYPDILNPGKAGGPVICHQLELEVRI